MTMLDQEALADLKYKQSIDPESIEMMEGSEDKDYQMPVLEQNYVHVELEPKRNFDPETGEKMVKPRVQKFTPREYVVNGFHGFNVRMLHRPVELAEMEAAAAKKKQ